MLGLFLIIALVLGYDDGVQVFAYKIPFLSTYLVTLNPLSGDITGANPVHTGTKLSSAALIEMILNHINTTPELKGCVIASDVQLAEYLAEGGQQCLAPGIYYNTSAAAFRLCYAIQDSDASCRNKVEGRPPGLLPVLDVETNQLKCMVFLYGAKPKSDRALPFYHRIPSSNIIDRRDKKMFYWNVDGSFGFPGVNRAIWKLRS